IAPNLDSDRCFIRLSGDHPLARRFAIRASIAYKGTWVRCAKTYARSEEDRAAIARTDAWFDKLIARIDVERPFHDQIAVPHGAHLIGWFAESPNGTRPLSVIASQDQPNVSLRAVPSLILTVILDVDGVPWCGPGLASLAHGKRA